VPAVPEPVLPAVPAPIVLPMPYELPMPCVLPVPLELPVPCVPAAPEPLLPAVPDPLLPALPVWFEGSVGFAHPSASRPLVKSRANDERNMGPPKSRQAKP